MQIHNSSKLMYNINMQLRVRESKKLNISHEISNQSPFPDLRRVL